MYRSQSFPRSESRDRPTQHMFDRLNQLGYEDSVIQAWYDDILVKGKAASKLFVTAANDGDADAISFYGAQIEALMAMQQNGKPSSEPTMQPTMPRADSAANLLRQSRTSPLNAGSNHNLADRPLGHKYTLKEVQADLDVLEKMAGIASGPSAA